MIKQFVVSFNVDGSYREGAEDLSDLKSVILKTCPFCGSPAEIRIETHIKDGYFYMPRCIDKSCAGRLMKKWKDRDEAVSRWNKRSYK